MAIWRTNRLTVAELVVLWIAAHENSACRLAIYGEELAADVTRPTDPLHVGLTFCAANIGYFFAAL